MRVDIFWADGTETFYTDDTDYIRIVENEAMEDGTTISVTQS